jgi:phosphatidylglycerol:prolipoprotein diacylglycerol transferase
MLIGLWLGLSLAEKFSAKRGVSPNLLYNLVFVTLVAGVIGSRLAYLFRYPEAFASSPLSLISLNPGLLDPVGGLVVGVISGAIYAQRQKMALWPTLDALTPLLAVMAISLGLSHLASGAAFGATTQVPWGIELWGAKRHPSQVYEIMAGITILLILWPGKWGEQEPAGRYFLLFVMLSALAQLILEAFRGDSLLLPGGWRVTQIGAWLLLAASLWGLHRLQTKPEISPDIT